MRYVVQHAPPSNNERNSLRIIIAHLEKLGYSLTVLALSKVYIVDRSTRDMLVQNHESANKILKPALRGRDVKRWLPETADYYLIKIASSENMNHPWSGKNEREAESIFAVV